MIIQNLKSEVKSLKSELLDKKNHCENCDPLKNNKQKNKLKEKSNTINNENSEKNQKIIDLLKKDLSVNI